MGNHCDNLIKCNSIQLDSLVKFNFDKMITFDPFHVTKEAVFCLKKLSPAGSISIPYPAALEPVNVNASFMEPVD